MHKIPFIELINSEHIHGADRVVDHLDDPAWVHRRIRSWRLKGGAGNDDLYQLRRFRDVLRAIVDELMTVGDLSAKSVKHINTYLGQEAHQLMLVRSMKNQFQIGYASLIEPSPTEYAAASFVRYLAEYDSRRIKLCQNLHCRWAFIDTSRNRSRKWCSSATCGNVSKVRAFRARQQRRLDS